MLYRIKIQSTSDLITNSSSEVFVVKANGFSFEEIKELIESGAKARYEAYRKDWDPDYTVEEFAEDEGIDVDSLDQYAWIDIDWARRGTIRFIYDNFEVVESDVC